MSVPPEEPIYDNAREALQWHRFLMRLANASVNAFLWIFIFSYFAVSMPLSHALTRTLLLYVLSQTVAILVMPAVLKFLGGNMLRTLVYGTLLSAATFVYMGTLSAG